MASATAVAMALAAAVIARPPVTTMVVVFAIVVAGDVDIGAPTGDNNGGCFPRFFSPIGALSRGLEHIGVPPWGIEVVVGTPPGAAVAVRHWIHTIAKGDKLDTFWGTKPLINACKKVFPTAKRLLCRWHINHNVIHHCRPMIHNSQA
ncbi:hypothetical protein OSB04_012404 [Centaurea solstitialis]|uniref:MULE transposase domain-containing protein n=1 Tax=Centaurea solstitialis TaxID=347529 RepID=A0AA38TBA7_9ASTR|nr:hypothetical protein OSB04_012404 [Centaurea solstitialis]